MRPKDTFINMMLVIGACISSANAIGASDLQLETTIDRFDVKNTPLIEALALLDELTSMEFKVDTRLLRPSTSLTKPVSIKARQKTVAQILRQMLPGSLFFLAQENQIFVHGKGDGKAGPPTGKTSIRFENAKDVAVRNQLVQKYPLHFDNVPLSVVVDCISGMSGLKISFEKGTKPRGFDFGSGRLVSIHENNIVLEDGLRRVLKIHDLAYVVRDGKVLIVTTSKPRVPPSQNRRFGSQLALLPRRTSTL